MAAEDSLPLLLAAALGASDVAAAAVTLTAGDACLTEGEDHPPLILLLGGAARADHASGPLGWFGPGAILGGRPLLLGQSQPWSVVPVRDTHALRIEHEDADRLLSADGALCRAVLRRVTETEPVVTPPPRFVAWIDPGHEGSEDVSEDFLEALRSGGAEVTRCGPDASEDALARILRSADIAIYGPILEPPPKSPPIELARLFASPGSSVLFGPDETLLGSWVRATHTLTSRPVRTSASPEAIAGTLLPPAPLVSAEGIDGEPCAAAVHALGQVVRLDTGERLFGRGEPADSVAWVLSGRLSTVPGLGGRVQRFGGGDCVGREALRGVEVRAVTTLAARPGRVLVLSTEAFRRIEQVWPTLTALRHEGFDHLGGATGTSATRSVFGIVPLGAPDDANQVSEALVAALAEHGIAHPVHQHELETLLGGTLESREPSTLAWLDRLEDRVDYPVIVCDSADGDWTRLALSRADRVLFVGRRTDTPAAPPLRAPDAEAHLVLLHDGTPKGSLPWIEAAGVRTWHHLRAGQTRDVASMTRRILGCATALALSGASSRGSAHLGILFALRKFGIEPDVYTGTSSGTCMAAVMGRGDSDEVLTDVIMEMTEKMGGTAGMPTLPLTSVVSGKYICHAVQKMFGDDQLEDLVVPARVSACDLVKRERVIFDRGPIWKIFRTTGSLPAILPPVVEDGRVLVDGGIMDTILLAPLAKDCARGFVYASTLVGTAIQPLAGLEPYGPWLSGWKILWDRLRSRGKPSQKYPDMATVVIESLVLESNRRLQVLAQRADPSRLRLFEPSIPDLGFFSAKPSDVPPLIEIARKYAEERLEAWASDDDDPPPMAAVSEELLRTVPRGWLKGP